MHSKFLHSFIAIAVVAFVLSTAPAVLSQYDVFAGYGYGYGACANAPSNLSVRYLTGKNQGKLALRWDSVEEDCEGVDYYQAQLSRLNGTVVEWWNVTNTRKRINLDTLNPNRTYKWRVRTVYEDGTTSSWSLYDTFRTPPGTPANIRASNIRATSVRISGKNVARSRLLKRYQVYLWQNDALVRVRSIKKRLSRDRFVVNFYKLSLATEYTLKIRAVYSTSLKSAWARKTFTTLAE